MRRATRRVLLRARASISLLAAIGLLASLGSGIVLANHTAGTLDCGAAGVWDVDGHLPQKSPIDRPVPWSGTFLLEGTTQVFHAFANDHFGIVKQPASSSPHDLLVCTLTSEGPMFETPWTLVGKLAP